MNPNEVGCRETSVCVQRRQGDPSDIAISVWTPLPLVLVPICVFLVTDVGSHSISTAVLMAPADPSENFHLCDPKVRGDAGNRLL